MDGWKLIFLLGLPIFRGYVSFREGIVLHHANGFFVVKVISRQALRPAVSRMMEEGAVQPRFLACLFTVCGTISDVQ